MTLKNILSYMAFILFQLCAFPNTAIALSLTQPEILDLTKKVDDYIHTGALKPLIAEKNWEFNYVDYTDNLQTLSGKITDGRTTYDAAFIVSKDKERIVFLYLADKIIPTQLFLDIYKTAMLAASLEFDPAYVPTLNNKPNIYIKNKKYVYEDGGIVDWMYFDKKILTTVKVKMNPDGNGGTDFSVDIKPKSKE